MQLKSRLLKLVVGLLGITVLGGCSLAPPDEEVCVTLSDSSAFCTFTISPIERRIPAEAWGAQQIGRFSLSANGFAEFQIFIEQACEVAKCTKREKKLRKKFLTTMERFNAEIY